MRLQVLILGVALLAADASADPPRAAARTSSSGSLTSERSLWFGAHASYADESDLGLGVRALWGPSDLGKLGLITSFDYFFPSGADGVVTVDARHWELNGNLAYAA